MSRNRHHRPLDTGCLILAAGLLIFAGFVAAYVVALFLTPPQLLE